MNWLQKSALVLSILLAPSLAWAQSTIVAPAPYNFAPLSPGQYTPVTDSASTALTIPPGATYAVVCAEVTSHRWTWDGTTTPTSSVGTLLPLGNCIGLSGVMELSNFRIIQTSAGGQFTVSYAK